MQDVRFIPAKTSAILKSFLGFLAILCAFSTLLANVTPGGQSSRVLHSLTAAVLGGACLFTAWQLFVKDPICLWTPIPWFLGTCAVYFGLGPQIYYWGGAESVAQADAFWPVESSDLIRNNLLNCLGISCVVLGALAGQGFLAKFRRLSRQNDRRFSFSLDQMARATFLFLAIGLPIRYLLDLPYQFGALQFILPGSIMMLRSCTSVAIAWMVILTARHSLVWVIPLALVLCSEVLVSVLTYGKIEVLYTLVMFFVGLYIVTPKVRILLPAGITLVVVYLLLVPLISFGRAQISLGNFNFYEASLAERFQIFAGYLRGDREVVPDESQNWWNRLNYVPAQTFAMQEFDGGRPIHDWQTASYAFVPRIFWPDKPSMTSIATYFNYLATGNPFSASAPGIFAEGYYSMGWTGTIALSSCAGFFLGGFTWYSRKRMTRGELLFLPIVLIGIRMGSRPDGWFVADYVGPAGVAICLHIGLRFVHSLLLRPMPERRLGQLSTSAKMEF
jgi:hypothetical protein